MSKINKKYFYIFAILVLFSVFAFGCKSSSTPVEAVSFNLTDLSGSEISLLVGDEYHPTINFVPTFASNKKYSLSSTDETVVQVSGNKIVAKKQGNALLTVSADDNSAIQDVIPVKVYNAPVQLGGEDVDAAFNLRYNETEKQFEFGEILGAAGYTLNINGEEIALGQRLQYSLAEYAENHSAFNTVLTAKVRANAPEYSHAFSSSNYSTPTAIYQVGEVANVKIETKNGQSSLTFDHQVAKNFNISINGEVQDNWQNISAKNVPLNNLPEKYAGETVALQISALIDGELESQMDGVVCYPSVSRAFYVNVLSVAELSLNASVAVWSPIANATGYEVFVDNQKVETTTECSYNLNEYESVKSIENGTIFELRVEPILEANNLAKTGKQSNVIKFSRNIAPALELNEEILSWAGEDGQNYYLEIYKNEQLVKSYATTEREFNLNEYDSNLYEIKVCELPKLVDEVYYLNSALSALKFSRLKTARLNYDKQENKFSISDENPAVNVKNYLINFSNAEQSFDDADLSGFNLEIQEGENEFVLTAISNGEIDGVQYLNAQSYNLTISKLYAPTSITIGQNDFEIETSYNFFNYLKIETQNSKADVLNVTISVNGQELKFKTNGKNLISADGKDYVLPCVFDDGNYYIALLDSDYLPYIDELKNDTENTLSFGVSAQLEGVEPAEVSSEKIDAQFSVCGSSSIAPVEQNLEIKNVNLSGSAENYYLLINDDAVLNLSSLNAEINGEKFVVKFNNLLQQLAALRLDVTQKFNVKILNTFENSVAGLSVAVSLQMAEMPTLKIEKNVVDTGANNAIKISANKTETEYKKQYIFKVYNALKTVERTLVFEEESDVSFFLEDIENYAEFEGDIYLSAFVLVIQQAADGQTYVFNSQETEPVKFTKLAEVENLKIDNGLLTFKNSNSNVSYFEIYAIVGGKAQKIGSVQAGATSFDLTNISLDGVSNLCVKAVAVGGSKLAYANSDLSGSISAQKTSLSVAIQNGDFAVTCNELSALQTLFEAGEGQNRAYIEVKNLTSGKTMIIDANNKDIDVDFAQNKVFFEAWQILNYGTKISAENLSFQLVVRYESENEETINFVNSKPVVLAASGLIKPASLSVKYLSDESGELVDYIEWNNELNPAEILYNYVLKVTYNGETYSSLNGQFESNGKEINLDETRLKLPTKFVPTDGEPIEFSKGNYVLEIKIYPTSKSSAINYCSSGYAVANVELLSPPELSVQNGIVVWEDDVSAQGYQIKITTKSGDEQIIYFSTTDNKFEFSTTLLDNISGLLGVQIQAISTLKNDGSEPTLKSVANSKWSEELLVYKLDNLSAASIDDGTLVLTANKFFTSAQIDFMYGDTAASYVFDNASYAAQQLSGLGIDGWQNLAGKEGNLTATRKYIVDLSKRDKNYNTINLVDGATYSIAVKLFGNYNANLPIVNSAKVETNLIVTKLQKADAKATERGKLNFTVDTRANFGEQNYNFNETEASLINIEDDLAKVYKLSITIKNETGLSNLYTIYALDYDYFIKKTTTLAEQKFHLYEETKGTLYGYLIVNSNGKEIYLNVYKNNILDFASTIIYYNAITVTTDAESGTFNYSMTYGDNRLSEIDLSIAGTFSIDVSLLAGDSKINEGTSRAFMTSSVLNREFHRYATNLISSSKGELRFKDLTPRDASRTPKDYPIYKITANSTQSKYLFYLYYKQSNLQDVKNYVAGKDDDLEPTFVEISKFEHELGTDYVWFEISNLLNENAASYDLTIQTLAGLGVDNNAFYYLDAFEPSRAPSSFYKYGLVSYSIDNLLGKRLKFNAQDGDYRINKFEICLIDTATQAEHSYTIDLASENVKKDGNNIYYTLPNSVGEIELNSTYKFKIRAIADDAEYSHGVINGSFAQTSNYTITEAEEIGNFAIQGGQLKFATPSNADNVYLQLSYTSAGLTKKLYKILNITNKDEAYQTYNFEDQFTDELNPNSKEFVVSDRNYLLNIFALGYDVGSNYVLNGNFVAADKDLIRLATASNITAQDGVLTWSEIPDAVGYTVVVNSLNPTKTYVTGKASLDLSKDLIAGSYQISIGSLGDDKVNSQISAAVEFNKLDKVDVDSIQLIDNEISWQAVDGANAYYYEIFSINENDVIASNLVKEATKTIMPASLSGKFEFRIQAQILGNSKTFNSQFATHTSSIEVPSTVSSLNWRASEFRFEITTSPDFNANDKIEIVCVLNKYEYQNGSSLSQTEETHLYQIDYNENSHNTYYFYPTIMGRYTTISARVRRGNILSPATMIYQNLDLQMFSAGDGENEPYIITTAQELLKVRYRADAEFKMNNSVNLSGFSISNFDGIVADEFTGKFNGGGFAILGINANISNSNFALFKTLNNAEIYNLNLGENGNSVSVSYDGNYSQDCAVAVLAQSAIGSTIQNVKLTQTTITVQGSINGNAYVAGLVAKTENSKILACDVALNINYKLNTNYNKYVGGVAGASVGGEFGAQGNNKTKVNFEITTSNDSSAMITYLGGLVGEYRSAADNVGKIDSVEVSVEFASINARNVGGIAGYLLCVDLSNSNASGTISSLTLNSSSYLNAGGVVGVLQSSILENITTNVDVKLNLSAGIVSNNIRAGILIGEISAGVSTRLSSVSNCRAGVDFNNGQTVLYNDCLGVYGYLVSSAVSGNITCSKVN